MKKTSRTVMLAVALALVTQVSAIAAPVSNQRQTQQSQNSLKEVQDKRHELELSIEKLDNQIEEYMMKIEENKKNITSTENDIEKYKKEITRVEEEEKDKEKMLEQRVKSIYMNGQLDYVTTILDSKSLSDLVTRVEAVRKIIGADKKSISDLDEKKVEVEDKKRTLEEKYDTLLKLKTENESKLTSLNSDIKSQKELIEEAKVQEKLYASKVDESQEVVNKTIAKVSQIKSEAPRYNPSKGTGAASVSDNNIIAYASNFLGTPYLWGGTSPSTGFDCSGFTQYVYAHFGIKLGRTTYDQINDGYGVSKSELKTGDLVFFGPNGDPTHMGIYIGNNTYIHAPRTGDVVKISSIDRGDYITARRVI